LGSCNFANIGGCSLVDEYSIFDMLQNGYLTCLFLILILSLQTWCHWILSVLLIVLWWRVSVVFCFLQRGSTMRFSSRFRQFQQQLKAEHRPNTEHRTPQLKKRARFSPEADRGWHTTCRKQRPTHNSPYIPTSSTSSVSQQLESKGVI